MRRVIGSSLAHYAPFAAHTTRQVGEFMALQPANDALPLLPISNLDQRHWGLTPPIAATYEEAARVCLDRHHSSPQQFVIEDDGSPRPVRVEWVATDTRTQNAWNNETDTTEAGAYGFALAATEICKGLVAVKRAETLTGADYYVAPGTMPIEDLEASYRLEVSGTISDRSVAKNRLKQKVEQTVEGISNLPALAAVVAFKIGLILLQSVGQSQ